MTTFSSPLDFHRTDTTYGPHGLHAFAAKLPPQLCRWAIERFSAADELVCDPFCGSGTTLVEALAMGRRAFGCDLDPLACLIASAKATFIDPDEMADANSRLTVLLADDRPSQRRAARHWRGVALPQKERWFDAQVARDLCAVKEAIAICPDVDFPIRKLWMALFSSLITAKHSVASARDIVHSRHHFLRHPSPPDTRGRFLRRLQSAERRISYYACGPTGQAAAAVAVCDARRLPLGSGAADLVVTSPPYCNALDYTRAHRFSVAWMEAELGVTLRDYVERGRRYIGSERGLLSGDAPQPVGARAVDEITERIVSADPARGRLVGRYVADMQMAIAEIGRALRPGGHAVIVVCPSHIRRIAVEWHEAFATIAERLPEAARLERVELIERVIDDSRRILPYMNAGPQLAQRMRREFVLVLRKQASGSETK